MSNRFNSTHNKPHRLNLASKQRVMAEFHDLQSQMSDIKQNRIEPKADPTMPEYLSSHPDAAQFIQHSQSNEKPSAVQRMPT